ncbi:MAG: hypothetical protein K6C97_00830 [Treponema sp.]|nr:hypothetical protein [Treponema sp.]
MKGKLLLCLAIIFSLSAGCIYAQSDDDVSLFEIDRLIRKTEYDEALRLLNIYIKNKPDNFDNAQTRVRRIMVARRQYSILAEKLIDLIQTDPGNNKEIYEITAQLERFERNPSDQNLEFISDLKKSAEFNYFRAQFLEIQNESAENTKKGQYVAAIEKTKEGFWLYREDFDQRWEDNPEIIAEVDEILEDLNDQISTFEERNYLPKIQDAVNDFVKAVNQEQYNLALQRFTNVQNYMRDYNRLRQAIIDDGLRMEEKFAQLKQIDSDSTDASFLPFMFRFIYGVDSVPDSGILGAIDGQWNAYAGQMNNAVFNVLSKNYNKYENGITSEYSNTIESYANLEQKVLDLYLIPKKDQAHYLENPYEEYYALSDYVKYLSSESLRITGVWNRVEETESKQNVLLSQIKDKESLENRSQALYELFDSNAKLGDLVGIRSKQELDSFAWTKPYKDTQHTDWDALSELYSQLLDTIFSKSSELLSSAWTQITQYYKESSDSLYAELLEYNESSEIYSQGFFTKIPQSILAELNADIRKATYYQDTFNENPELDFGINYAYPDISLKIAQYVQKQVDLDIGKINDYEKEITSGIDSHQEWKSEENLVSIVNEANIYLENQKKNLAELKNLAKTNESLAQAKIVASQLARNEADIRYREAQNALREENFDTARKKLQDAVSKYDESLANLNDEVLRSQVDQRLQELGQQIAKTENEVVVKEVRELKTKAKDAYFNGRFEDAEKYLNQAKTRWAVTNVIEDEEITNLLNFVNTAISMKTGRDILPSAPQYQEMSQLLNLAYQFFDEGSRKIGEGNKEEGFKDLDSALLNIQQLQYVYPLNQEAAILTLRINRLKDPQKFKEEFDQKVQTAKLMCQSKETQQEGYANLLDYAQLQPDYPGLKSLIYQVEIDIGIRQKPIDNSGANKAKRLIAEAQKAFNNAGTNTKKLEAALEKINQALALDSDNQNAIALKDKITTIIGGNTSTVLSTEDERLYQLAIQRLQNNNIVGANAIVEQLLKKASNANSQKIKDLKNKIDART